MPVLNPVVCRFPGCGRLEETRGLCVRHFKRACRGRADSVPFLAPYRTRRQRAFEDLYTPEPNTGCWLWTGGTYAAGYPVYKGKLWGNYGHRAALYFATGICPPDLFACHRCDQPLCVNPAHLYWGTARDNAQDRDRRGRDWFSRSRAATLHQQHAA
jgi:hypothetical protein